MRILKINEYYNVHENTKIGFVTQKILIAVDMESSKHAVERQERHLDDGGTFIPQSDIKDLMLRAIDDLTKMLVFDEININDAVLLTNTGNDINVVCAIKGERPNLRLVAVTVMRKKNFKPYPGQKHLKF